MVQHAFLNAIAANPADDAPRLIYADWLQEEGDDDRAELIRRQIRLARLNPWDAGYTSEEIHCAELIARHPEWLGPFTAYVDRTPDIFGCTSLPFQRGFLNHVELTPSQFLEHGKELLQRQLVKRIRLNCNNGLTQSLEALSCRDMVREVELSNLNTTLAAQNARRLLGQMPALQHLGLRYARFECNEGNLLLKQVFRRPLSSFAVDQSLSWSRICQELGASNQAELRQLNLGCRPYMNWADNWFQRLERVRFFDTRVSGTTADFLDILPQTKVKELRIDHSTLTSKRGTQLAEALSRSSVEFLVLTNPLTYPAILASALTKHYLATLRGLALMGTTLDGPFIEMLIRTRTTRQWRVLWLHRINQQALQVLAKSEAFPKLESLRLGLIPMTHAPAGTLQKLLDGRLRRLRSLCLQMNRRHFAEPVITPKQVRQMIRALVDSSGTQQLEEVRLDYPDIDRSAVELLRKTTWPKLKLLTLKLPENAVTIRDILKQHFGPRVRFFTETAI